MSGRPERPSKKVRRLSTDSEGTEEPIDWAVTGTKTSSTRAERPAGAKNDSSYTQGKFETRSRDGSYQ
ncbi:hypothetical protein WAI453_006301 [Rhynchosporium graminicola]